MRLFGRAGDTARAQELIDRALELQKDETDVDAHFDSLIGQERDRQ